MFGKLLEKYLATGEVTAMDSTAEDSRLGIPIGGRPTEMSLWQRPLDPNSESGKKFQEWVNERYNIEEMPPMWRDNLKKHGYTIPDGAKGQASKPESGGKVVDLKKHDARFHGGSYDGKSSCKYREDLAKGDDADAVKSAEKQEADATSASTPWVDGNGMPTKQGYDDLMAVRDRLEPIARLLNGRTGNLQALQSSSRWHKLQNYPIKHVANDTAVLCAIGNSKDKAMAKAANDLMDVVKNIVKSSANNWNDPAGMVLSRSDIPRYKGSTNGSSSSGGSSAPNGGSSAPASSGPSGAQSSGSYAPFQSKSAWANALDAVNQNHPAINDPDYFKNKADALTPAQAVADMESRGDIVKGGYRDAIDRNDPDEGVLWAGWRPSKSLSADTARCCSVCFEDMRSRFPNMPWKNNLELRCGTKPMTGGQSTHTADDSRHTVLFNCDYGNIWGGTGLGKSNYGHPDARFPFDVLRHEMGHALMSGSLPNGKRMISKWHNAMTAAYGYPARDLEKFAGKYVSQYAVTNKGRGFSMAECLSECFSLATSPDYKAGYLPPPVEDFIFGEMLGMKK